MTKNNNKLKNNKELIIYPFRLIPFDLGCDINDSLSEKIQKCLRSSYWEENSEKDDNKPISYKHKCIELYLHIYKDGIGIFTFKDSEEKYSDWKKYNPQKTMDSRKDAHNKILAHKHEISKYIKDTLNMLWDLSKCDSKRFSASPDWERGKGGLSYVMSFYFIKCEPNIVQEKNFQEKLVMLLFPHYDDDERKGVDYSDEIKDKNNNNLINSEFIKMVKYNFEMLPHLHTCASWSNFLIIGKISDQIINEYWYLQIELQHIWYYTYITDKFIERSLKNINASTLERDLNTLDNILTDMMFKINKYEGIFSSVMHERDFRLYEGLRKTSRLDLLVKNVEKKASILKSRYNWLLKEKRMKADKKIQFILFLIAWISGFGVAYEILFVGKIWYAIIFVIILLIGLLIGVLLFDPFLGYSWHVRAKDRA